jgi:RHS repeat-associated protein
MGHVMKTIWAMGADDMGLTYMNARYYVSYIYRMVSADTIVPDPANPQTFNRYSYVLNNPVRYTDPTGHCGVDATQALIDQCIAERDQLSDYYDISFTGQWLLSEILTTKLSLQDLEAGLGGVNYFQSKFGGVTLSRLTGTNSNPAKVDSPEKR